MERHPEYEYKGKLNKGLAEVSLDLYISYCVQCSTEFEIVCSFFAAMF